LNRGGGLGFPVVTWTFLALCVGVTVPSMVFPSLYGVFGGIGPGGEPAVHFWQPFTAVFEHGWPGFPAPIHLALNAFLILECGRPTERLLGSGRFLVLCVASAGANAVAQLLTEGVNGSSLVIWSWGPPLALALVRGSVRARGGGEERLAARLGSSGERLRGVLVVMYVVVTGAMTVLPYAAGWRGDPLSAFVLGNRYHLVATGVGVVFALSWRGRIAGVARSV